MRNAGDGPVASVLLAPVPDLQGKVVANNETAQLVMWGQGLMPGYEVTFGKAEAIRVLKYQASLGPEKALLSAREKARREAEAKRKKPAVPGKPKPPVKTEPKPAAASPAPDEGPERPEGEEDTP